MAFPSFRHLSLFTQLLTSGLVYAQSESTVTEAASATVGTATISGTPTTYRPIFTIPVSAENGGTVLPNTQDPQAVDVQNACPGYLASDVVRSKYGFSATLSLAGEPCNVYGTDVDTLNFTVEYQNADRLSINISPAYLDSSNSSWYITSDKVVDKPLRDSDADTSSAGNDFFVTWTNEPTFSFTVIRRSTGDVVFTTKDSVLVYENQFLEMVVSMPENYNVYGLGEHIHSLRLGNNYTATMFSADAADPVDFNIYGVHPFYLDTRFFKVDGESGEMTLHTSNETDPDTDYVSYSHGVYLRNAHAQEVLLKAENITWRTLGGSFDLYFLDGPSAPEVTMQYQEGIVGLPTMQSYWTFGFHQCRWGYTNISQLQDVVDNFASSGIPLETIWSDIDYMNQYRDFTTDNVTMPLPEFHAFLTDLHDKGQHWVPIVDAAIYIPNPQNASDAYPTYERGHEADIFLKNPDGSEYIGAVWPGYTVFPDWHNPSANAWWAEELKLWHNEAFFSGIWIDMNEPSSFCIGSCGSNNLTMNPVHPPFILPGDPGNVDLRYPEGFNITNATEAASVSALSSSLSAATPSPSASSAPVYIHTTPEIGQRNIEYPPYVINNYLGELSSHTVASNATHYDGSLEYDYHSTWGHQLLNATYHGLLEVFPGKRPFIIGRSTFAGSGKWAGHWGGDNVSLFYYMLASIPQALSFSLFGIPMFGPDTCGFAGNSDLELCSRWMQLSAFFPFYRNHNVLQARPQEPYLWAGVTDASKTAMSIRYSLLPYMYTLFHLASTTGSTVMRALSWEFPNDPSLAGADRQFLLGPSLLITPVLNPGDTTVNGVFPGSGKGEVWYDWYSQTAVQAAAGENKTIDAPLGHIPVFVRGGAVLPMQAPGYTTRQCRQNPWNLIVALSLQETASGQIYIDDGESLTANSTLWVELATEGGALYATARGEWVEEPPLANVTVLGVDEFSGNVTFNGNAVNGDSVSWNETSGVLAVTGLEVMTGEGAWSADWVLRWG
ncbi:glycoside hydrolase family 31 protein [Patellaria atrata CBS 101060]|uniref:alpha-glucosidase n=1 Tax=Patellaria atrata CBS 101060 TaxID=1346257 RepID=A0A9P4SBC2_9PEZI|nr:glycoside hydrolase family 31 protein [Patellaria atrata CBS 101060]